MLLTMVRTTPYAHWQALMVAAQQGDSNAYHKLLRDIAPLLTNFLRKRMPDHLVEDTVQEILLALHKVHHTYQPSQPFHAWLFAIARHKSIDAMRKNGRISGRESFSLSDVETFLAAPTNTQEQSDIKKDLALALNSLNDNQRTIVELLKLQGWSLAEVAQHTGQSVAAVKVSAHRAYKTMKEVLTKS